jgi:hypothetical protein
MNIRPGPMINRFAAQIDTSVAEVLKWANSYVNEPDLFVQTEKTAEERAESIKKYITFRVENSINTRIRQDILRQKEENNAKSL